MELESMMIRLGQLGHSVVVWYVLNREVNAFDVIIDGALYESTDDPALSLMEWEESALGE